MLTENQLDEIREHLEKSQNPLFFFDNDADGLCSFLLLARAFGKGKGVAIKPSFDSSYEYARKVHELNPDYVFVLDKPLISKIFIEEVGKMNLPLVWIDHHNTDNIETNDFENFYYYNSGRGEHKSREPTTFWMYKLGRKEDLWLAVIGCIADNFLPDFTKEFKENYPELLGNEKTAFQILYETEIGKIARIFNFALKDRTSNVVKMIKFLLKINSVYEILKEENPLIKRFNQIDTKYQKLVERAENFAFGEILFFQYSGDLSISSDIANKLIYKYPEKLIVVVYVSNGKANISIRGRNAREITSKAISGFENATGGGHEEATGAKINLSDLEEFRRRIEELGK